jgi:hypothetical protein
MDTYVAPIIPIAETGNLGRSTEPEHKFSQMVVDTMATSMTIDGQGMGLLCIQIARPISASSWLVRDMVGGPECIQMVAPMKVTGLPISMMVVGL